MSSAAANKEKGTYWEIVLEKTTMKHVVNYEREVADGGRRYDFELRNEGGEPKAIVEVKSGEIADAEQISDFIDAASQTETRTLIIAHPDPGYVLDLLEKHPELLEKCGQLNTRFIIKDLSVLEDLAQKEHERELEAERIEKEQAERQRLEKEAAENAERERSEQAERDKVERAEREQAELAERSERERTEKETAEQKRLERAEQEGIEGAERAERSRVEREEAERETSERAEREKAEETERAERERAEQGEREASELAEKEYAERQAAEALMESEAAEAKEGMPEAEKIDQGIAEGKEAVIETVGVENSTGGFDGGPHTGFGFGRD